MTNNTDNSDKVHRNLFTMHLLKFLLILILVLIISSPSFSQDVHFESSNLPIIVIDTNNKTIPDEPKITAYMGIINNGEGNRNNLSDLYNEYDGFIGIERRGYSSQSWPKKSYTLETRDEAGQNNNVSLFEMPPENDWVLYAPYVDKTLMRNVLIYKLARDMGWYAPRTQFCELVLNGEYMGVYVLVEKLKKDKNRLNISAPDLTDMSGGYLLEMTLDSRIKDDETTFICRRSHKPIVVKYPKFEDITDDQVDWIEGYFNEFEKVLQSANYNDPENGYLKYIDLSSFIDHMLIAEGFNQLDAFSHSQYFYKVKNGKLFMGPAWDYNRTMGNAKYFTVWKTSGWWLLDPRGGTRAFYANRLMEDPVFMVAYKKRWLELRQTLFSFDNIYPLIDNWTRLLEESRKRNFERWPVLGVSISHKYVFDTYEEEVDYMKNWIFEKFSWLDEQFVNYEVPTFTFSDDPFWGNARNYQPLNASRWAIVQDEGDYRYFLNTSDYESLSGGRLGEYSLVKDRMYGDFQLSFKAKSNENFANNSWADFCVAFGYKDAENYSYAMFNSNTGETGNAIFAVISGERVLIESTDQPAISDNSYHTYEVVRVGSTVSLKKNGQIYLSTTDDRLSTFGSVGVGSFNDAVYFDDIYINNFSTVLNDKKKKSADFVLTSNCPNPFNPTTTISYSIPANSYVRIIVYNLLGEHVATLVDQELPSGNHSIKWDARDKYGARVANGTYIYQIKANGFMKYHKMLLLQ